MVTRRRGMVAAVLLVVAVTGMTALRALTDDGATTLWVYAHPDDETLTAAGAMLDERDKGLHIVLLLTNGGGTHVAGEPGYPQTTAAVGDAREREARAALGIMELYEVRFGKLEDGAVTPEDAAAVIRDHVEDLRGRVVVRTHSPLDVYSPYGVCGHPDHCATAEALLDLHAEELIDDLRLYRIAHFFDGHKGGNCRTLDDAQHAFKQEMRRQYAYRRPEVGRYGIAARSVPGPWQATETQPECFDTPAAIATSP